MNKISISATLLLICSSPNSLLAGTGPQFLTLPFNNPNTVLTQGWIYDNKTSHEGIDYAIGVPSVSFPILSAAAGEAVVVLDDVNNMSGYGNFVYVAHNDFDSAGLRYFTLYAHLVSGSWPTTFPVKTIKQLRADIAQNSLANWVAVQAGDQIGMSGETGDAQGIHLHFEIQRGGYPGGAYTSIKTDPYDIYSVSSFYPDPCSPQSVVQNDPGFAWTQCPPMPFSAAINPAPSVVALSTAAVLSGSVPQTITIIGSGFLASSAVTFNSVNHTATFLDSSHLTIALLTADLAAPGIFPVIVTNPPPGGGVSSPVYLSVTSAAITPQIVVVAGGGSTIPTIAPRSALNALLQAPSGIAVDTAGNLYIADEEPALLEKMNASTGQIVVITGSGQIRASTSPIPAASANIEVEVVAIDGAGNLYIDDGSSKVDRIDASTGNVVLLAGGGSISPSTTPIAATSANISVYGVAADNAGNLYIAGGTVEKVDATTGKMVVVAGGGSLSPSTTPIAATSARISALAVAVDTQGNLYIADGSLIERLNLSTGQIVVVAGGGSSVPSTIPIAATSANIYALALAADGQGYLYIATGNSGLIEKLNLAAGQIVAVAGGGSIAPTTTPATATNSSIVPIAIAVDGAGNLYVGDMTHSTVTFGNAFVEKVIIH